jgi:hypothetical protein
MVKPYLGDQIGRFSAFWVILNFEKFLLQSSQNILGLLFPQ